MSVIYGNPIITSGGGVKLNIDYGATPPSDTSKLWVPLSGKPDKVECTPTIQFGDNTIEKLSAVIPAAQAAGHALAIYGVYLYIVGGGSTTSFSSATTTITKVNLKTGASQTLSVALPEARMSSFYATINNKLYIIGGVNRNTSTPLSTVYIFDLATETISNGTAISPGMCRDAMRMMNSCVAYGSKIYILGYAIASGRRLDILSYDTADGSTTNTGKNSLATGSAVTLVNGVIYAFCGKDSNNSTVQKYFKYDISANTVTTLGAYLFDDGAVAAVGKYIYLFQGFYGSFQNAIQRFNTETNSFETLSVTTTNKCGYRQIVANGLDIYVCAGNLNTSSPIYNTIEKFSVNSPLTKNNLFLQQDFGTDSLWSALKSKDTDFKVKVTNAYLGDSNNIAQLTNAYLYDTTSQSWKSLSGESYVADMQNALNILGVN